MQATQSDTYSNESDSTVFKDHKYEQSDYLAFVTSIDYVHKFEIECEFTDKQNDEFLEKIVVEYQCLIEKFMKVNDIFYSQKFEINMLCEENINHIEKIQFLKIEYQSILERNDILT